MAKLIYTATGKGSSMLVFSLAFFWALGCQVETSLPQRCDGVGTRHDERITVERNSENGTSLGHCAQGSCYGLCLALRGNPGDGSRVSIHSCDLVDADGGVWPLDDATDAPTSENEKGDAGPPAVKQLTVHIVYDVIPCR